MTGSWIDVNRVVSAHPGPRDSFIVTLADGKQIDVSPADQYDRVLSIAKKLARETKLAVKVLPMTAKEFFAFTPSAEPESYSAEQAAADRQLVVATCRQALLDCDDRSVRAEAHALLVELGEASC